MGIMQTWEKRDRAFWEWLRLDVRCARYSFRVFLATGISLLFVLPKTMQEDLISTAWIFITSQVIATTTVGESSFKGLSRALGTMAAAGLAVILALCFPSKNLSTEPLVAVFLLILMTVGAYNELKPRFKPYAYFLVMFRVSTGVVAIMGWLADNVLQVAASRSISIMIGVCVWLLVERIYSFDSYASDKLIQLMAANIGRLDRLTTSISTKQQKRLRTVPEEIEEPPSTDDAVNTPYEAIVHSRGEEAAAMNSVQWELKLLRRRNEEGILYNPVGRSKPALYARVLRVTRKCAFLLKLLDSVLSKGFDVTEPIAESGFWTECIFMSLDRLAGLYSELGGAIAERRNISLMDMIDALDAARENMESVVQTTSINLLRSSSYVRTIYDGRALADPSGDRDAQLAAFTSLIGARRALEEVLESTSELVEMVHMAQLGNRRDFND